MSSAVEEGLVFNREHLYLTTAIAYPSGRPGLHTLYEVIAADAIARWGRLCGRPVRFLTGLDEHSANIPRLAAAAGLGTRAYIDDAADGFRAIEDRLLIAPDRFIRTSDPDHARAVAEIITRVHAAGDLYLADYSGWYCPNEGFRAESELAAGPSGLVCPNHPTALVERVHERDWFFRLSRYRDALLAHFESHPDFVAPASRRNEVLSILRSGLEDVSVSRAGSGWGIPFPAFPEDGRAPSTVYVWFDALTNYLTGAGFPDEREAFGRWWPADLHVVGKDINRFHSLLWPGILLSAGLPLPGRVWVHGWLLSPGGARHSKSLGNSLAPEHLVDELGADGLRWAALSELPFDRDAEVTAEALRARYNSELANGLGNLVSRVSTLAAGRTLPPPAPGAPLARIWAQTLPAFSLALESCLPHEAVAALAHCVEAANVRIQETRPWELAKLEDEAARLLLEQLLSELVEICRLLALASSPLLPAAAPVILTRLGHVFPYDSTGSGGPDIRELAAWGAAGAAGAVTAGAPIFPRLPKRN